MIRFKRNNIVIKILVYINLGICRKFVFYFERIFGLDKNLFFCLLCTIGYVVSLNILFNFIKYYFINFIKICKIIREGNMGVG